MNEVKLSWEEIFLIRAEIDKKITYKYGIKKPSKKQYILEVIKDRGGSVSLLFLSRIMHYKKHLLENWVLKLNAEHKICVKGLYPDWILVKKEVKNYGNKTL